MEANRSIGYKDGARKYFLRGPQYKKAKKFGWGAMQRNFKISKKYMEFF